MTFHSEPSTIVCRKSFILIQLMQQAKKKYTYRSRVNQIFLESSVWTVSYDPTKYGSKISVSTIEHLCLYSYFIGGKHPSEKCVPWPGFAESCLPLCHSIKKCCPSLF